MKSVAGSFSPAFIHLLLVVLLPAGVFAAEARSSMEVSAQVVREDYSTAAAALIEAAAIRGPANPAVDSGAECEAIGNSVIADGVWATCSWDADSRVYLVTLQY
jgi:hypothetical protein